jgi:hypothetical protein
MMRFRFTNEFADYRAEDWLDNQKWFDVKLLIDVATGDKKKQMSNDSYSTHVKNILGRLQLPQTKLCHLGRNIGAKTLQLFEAADTDIRIMGNWDPSMVDKAYSAQLPLKPIRSLAGYTDESKFYFNTRSTINPCQKLLEATPIGQWIYVAYSEVLRQPNVQSHTTAVYFLKFLMDLNEIFLQDSAAMFHFKLGREQHSIFTNLEVFRLEEWKVSHVSCLLFICSR